MTANQKYHKVKPWMKHLIYARQRCYNINNTHYRYYGAKGIKCLLTKEDIEFLWFRDKAYLLKQPSIDRKNLKNNYELKNCQFIEKLENSTKDWKLNIGQFSKENKLLSTWNSAREAAKKLNICRVNISACLRNQSKYKTAGGFIWKYLSKEK